MTLHIERHPDFSRLRKALMCQGEADRVPFIELGVHRMFKEQIIGHSCLTVPDEIEFAQRAGYDYIKIQPVIDMNPGKIYPAGGPQTFTLGVDTGERRWADEHGGAINSWEDFERYVWARPEDVNYSRLEEAARILPPDIGLIGQYGDIFTFVWTLMGFENFSLAIYEQPDLIDALFERVGGIICNLFENMASMERMDAMWFSDDLAYTGGLMISPNLFRKHLFPWVKKIGDFCRRRGIPFLYHSDGKLWEVIDDLIVCGVTALHPIEPKAMDIAEVKRRYAGRLAVLGNVEVDLLSRGSTEDVEAQVRAILRRAAPGGGFALGSSNSVPEYVKPENYAAMLNAGDRWGIYPIEM
ncbi:MAG: uroporphyrinogen decarboxylase family protein [bacterium]